MKKICAFLIMIFAFTLVGATEVKAAGATFYEAETIPGVYMVKEKGKTHLYQTARFFRKNGDNKAAYCLEPFDGFYAGNEYSASATYANLSKEQRERITKIAYYGYGNRTLGHTDPIWYAVTQLMIWQTAIPDGNFYFTSTLNGSATSNYDNYINEINNYVNLNDAVPSFNYNSFIMRVGAKFELKDNNNVISYFKCDDPRVSINKETNTLTIYANEHGNADFTLYKDFDQDVEDLYFFDSMASQDLMTVGKPNIPVGHVIALMFKTKVKINKVDADTKTCTPTGEGILKGAEYDVLDEHGKVVRHIVIDKNCEAYFEDIDFGTYYLKETKAGKGYTLDKELHKFTIDQYTFEAQIKLENEIIKKRLKIYKKFGNDKESKPEAGIVFNVFDSKGELVESIVTDEEGFASIELPYGTYTVKQENTKEGYKKVDDFEVKVTEKNSDKMEYELLDYVIEVPNTEVNHQNCYFIVFLMIITSFGYVRKKVYLQ